MRVRLRVLFAEWSKQELLVSALSLGRMSESFFYEQDSDSESLDCL